MASIGFLSNQLDNRGTGNALYNYAHYNEEILGNKSIIYTFEEGNHDDEAVQRFIKRFTHVWPYSKLKRKEDVLYHIKSGYNDGFRPYNDIPYLVHSVFDNDPHGTVYATISPWMGERFNLPYVPHIVEIADTKEDLREELGIPKDAVVFGRYGGTDSFDIPFVWGTMDNFQYEQNVYFLLMNTDVPEVWSKWWGEDNHFISLPATVDPVRKRKFINTCDAMIHARGRGETFGIAVGEFAIAGKPVITYSESHEKAHLQELGNFALLYNDRKSLWRQFEKVLQGPMVSWGYGQYTPELVMKKFKTVFLDGLNV